jgi:predicted RNA-binding Zn-ribbon protein involved in translation (DUF1610 family)
MTEFHYRLCPRCARAVPIAAQETYCPNDGEKLLERCPHCQARIRNPYARHCTDCGFEFAELLKAKVRVSDG